MKKIVSVSFLFILCACGVGDFYFIDNNTSKTQYIEVKYVENDGDLKEIFIPPDSLKTTTSKNYTTKTHKWYKNAQYLTPYKRIDEYTYELKLDKNEKVMIPYRYRLTPSINQIVINNKEKIFLIDSVKDSGQSVNYKSENLSPLNEVQYKFKSIGDSYYHIKINDSL